MSRKNKSRTKLSNKERKTLNNLYSSEDKTEEEEESWEDEWEDLYEENFMQNRKSKIRRSEKRDYREV